MNSPVTTTAPTFTVTGIPRPLTARELAIYEGRSGLSEERRQLHIASWKGERPAGSRPAADPCPYLGGPTGETEQCPTCSGNVRVKVFGCAVHGTCTAAKKAKSRACCAGCPDRPAARNRVTVPEPPPLNVTPRHSRVVVTVAAGEEGRGLLEISRPWMEAYARRVGADFLVLDWLGVPGWGQSAKLQLHRVLDHYPRAVFFDADTLADPEQCPDLFALVPEAAFGIYDDLPGLSRLGTAEQLLSGYRVTRADEGMPPLSPVPSYLNTGVMVFGRWHRDILAVPSRPIKPTHTAEQNLWVARLHEAGTPIFSLPPACNWQWWEQDHFRTPPPPWAIAHFSGLRPQHTAEGRMEIMRTFIPPGPSTPPAGPVTLA